MKKVLLLLLFSFALLGTNSARTDSLMIRYSDWTRETIGHGDGSADHFSAKALVK